MIIKATDRMIIDTSGSMITETMTVWL
jgi:hypothetical protein